MTHSSIRAAVLLAASLAVSGCSSDRDVLARVGGTVITVPDFDDIAVGSAARYAGPPDSAKAQLLDDLITRALLIEEAKRRGLAADSGALRMRRAIEDRLIVESLLQRLAPTDVGVSEAEVREFHAWRAIEGHLYIVFTPTLELAEAARLELARGAAFREVADRYNIRGFVPEGGDLGWIVPGSIVPPLDDVVRDAPLGEVQGPLRAPGEGWFVAVASERRPRDQGGYEEQRSVLSEMVRQRKQRAMRQQALESLRDAYGVRLERGGAQAMYIRAAMGLGGRTPPPLSDADKARVLARYDDASGSEQTYTMGDAHLDLMDAEIERPSFTMVTILQQWIETQVLRRIAKIEARRRHLQDEPSIARRVRERFHSQLVDELYAQEILGTVQVSPEDVRAEYDRMSGQFSRLDVVRLAWVEIPDSAAAAALAAAAATGPLPASAGAREETVRFPTSSPRWNLLEATFTATTPGGVMGPFPLEGGWFVGKMIDKVQVRQPFERLESAFLNMLETNALESKREARLREWTARLKDELHPEVHAERLSRVTWPAAIGG
jgi:parvulin-like peptidyl-prolyl isomerase